MSANYLPVGHKMAAASHILPGIDQVILRQVSKYLFGRLEIILRQVSIIKWVGGWVGGWVLFYLVPKIGTKVPHIGSSPPPLRDLVSEGGDFETSLKI